MKTDFAGLSREYRFWIEHAEPDRLVENLRRRLPPGSAVLDAGCGEGRFSVALAPYVNRVVALDLEPEMIALARSRARSAGVDNLTFLVGDLARLPVAAHSFDLVVSSFALHHAPVETALEALARTVKAGGWLFMQEPCCPLDGALRPLWYRWHGLRLAGAALRGHGPAVAWRVGRFHQGRDWIHHQLEDRHWHPDRWRETVARALPGAVCQPSRDRSAMVVLWRRGALEANGAEGERAPGSRTRVVKRYPQPPPEDYVPFPRSALEDSVVARFQLQVARRENHVALRTGCLELTYGGLNTASNRLSGRLRALGAGRGSPIAVLMDQDDPVVPAILGVLKAGGAYVVLDPSDAPERWTQILSLSGAQILVTTAARQPGVTAPRVRAGHTVVWEELEGEPDVDPDLYPGTGDVAAVFFTSGSTGEPKGVARDHGQLLHSTWTNTNDYFVSASDRQTLLYFPGFTASVPNIYDTLLNGATLAALNPRGVSVTSLLDWLRRERITHFNPPVGLWRQLVQAMPDTPLPDLRLVTLAGEPIYESDVKAFQTLFAPGTTLLFGLAMTETGAVTRGYIDHATEADGAVLAGYPLPDKTLSILNDDGTPAAPGETGRVAVTSAYLSLGYWRDTPRTEAVFGSADGGTRVFRTEDRGRILPDGCLEHFGRADSVVKVRGFRVDTGAIEAALNALPGVVQAAVVPRKRVDGHTFLLACLVAPESRRPSVDGLRAHLRRFVSHFMIPERFIWLDEMPLTASGKINRRALSAVNAGRPELSEPYVAPRTELERRIADCWAQILELDAVGVNDDFFELGGDSLQAMTMIQKIEDQISGETSHDLLNASTVAQMARLIGRSTDGEELAPRPADLSASASPLEIPGPLKLLRRLMNNGPAWRGFALPYRTGVRLQRALASRLWLMELLYARQLRTLQRWRAELGDDGDQSVLTASLLSNTWKIWRSDALAAPAVFDEWVAIDGGGRSLLENGPNGRSVVFVCSHAVHLMPLLERVLQSRGWQTTIVGDELSDNPRSPSARAAHARATHLRRAQRILESRGAVLIAGDGLHGSQAIPVVFRGRRRPFQIGAAWLAVEAGADFVPVFTWMNASGRVRVEVNAPLQAVAASDEDTVTELTRLYGELYAERWPRVYASTAWRHLDYNWRPRSGRAVNPAPIAATR